MIWNQGYTQKKQKEMNKAIKESNKHKKQSLSPYGIESWGVDTTSTLTIQQEKRRKEKMLWVIGWIIIGLVAILGISSIVWVSINL